MIWKYVLNKKDLICYTKYEFGRDVNGNIILIDEVILVILQELNTYENNFNRTDDKDCIRDYVKRIN